MEFLVGKFLCFLVSVLAASATSLPSASSLHTCKPDSTTFLHDLNSQCALSILCPSSPIQVKICDFYVFVFEKFYLFLLIILCGRSIIQGFESEFRVQSVFLDLWTCLFFHFTSLIYKIITQTGKLSTKW